MSAPEPRPADVLTAYDVAALFGVPPESVTLWFRLGLLAEADTPRGSRPRLFMQAEVGRFARDSRPLVRELQQKVRERELPADSPDLRPSEIERFYSKVHLGGCGLVWAGEVNNMGYGAFVIYRGSNRQKRTRLLAHRLMYKLMTGDEPGDCVVRHGRDTPICLTPDCLAPGTQGDNIRDAVERGRLDTSGLMAYHAARDAGIADRISAGKKLCPGCGITKTFAEFGRNCAAADDLTSRCKACLAIYRREYSR